jgi:hypothetical protein
MAGGYNWATLLLRANKYRNLALQVAGVSKIDTMKYYHESYGTQA